jgi:2-haloalkanoic acid dehalogenase type II
VLFDFGGTLYDYQTLDPGEREALLELAREAGVAADPDAIHGAHRRAVRGAFRQYLGRPFYLHADFFRDALLGMGRTFGVELAPEHLARYRDRQWELHRRHFALREGVLETLRELRGRGLHLGIVSNIDEDQLLHMSEIAGIRGCFDSILSSEAAGSCKPDSRIYEQALARAGCKRDEAIFVGDSLAQDIAGANRAGIRCVLLWHRDDRPPPDEVARPDHVIRRIPELLDVIDRETNAGVGRAQ